MTARLHRPHEVRELPLSVVRAPEGGLRVTTPLAPGWAGYATTPGQLARVVEAAYVEVTVAAYSRARGVVYDHAATADRDGPMPTAGSSRHPAEPAAVIDELGARRQVDEEGRRRHHPDDWQVLDDGAWLSPGGHRYRAESRQVQQVQAARQALAASGAPEVATG